MQTHFRITNLSCEACVKLSSMALREIPGVENVSINIHTGDSFVETSEQISFNKVQCALREVGKEVEQILK